MLFSSLRNWFLFIARILFDIAVVLLVLPIFGVLVRFRVDYQPRTIHLVDNEAETESPGKMKRFFKSGYVEMWKKVYRNEGFFGFYKGSVASSVSVFMTANYQRIVLAPLFHIPMSLGYQRNVFIVLLYSICLTPTTLSAFVFVTRAIYSPYRLSIFKPILSIKALLSPTELRRPWLILFTPGLFAAQVLHISYTVLVLGSFRRLLLPGYSLFSSHGSPIRLAIFLFLLATSVVVLTPLEVIALRVCAQRTHRDGYEREADLQGLEKYTVNDVHDTVRLRDEDGDEEPYIGLFDALSRITKEEGLATLYRGWWFGLLGSWGGALA